MTNCQWFALCSNRAATHRHHPILGMLPVCLRCAPRAKTAPVADAIELTAEFTRWRRVRGRKDTPAARSVFLKNLRFPLSNLIYITCNTEDNM